MLAHVYLVMSFVTVNVPNAPEPLACIRRSGITSLSKCAICSKKYQSCISKGPLGPAVILFSLSDTGVPKRPVNFLRSLIRITPYLFR